MGNGKKLRNILEQLNIFSTSIPFLKGAVMNVKAMLFSTLVTVRQN